MPSPISKNKTSAITKKTAQAIIEKPSLEGVREIIQTAFPVGYDPDKLLENLRDDVFFRLKKRLSKGKHGVIVEGDDARQIRRAMFAYGTDTHLPLVESVGEIYRPMVIRNVREIEKEYDCKTPTEKMLAEIMVGAHTRILQYSRRLDQSTRLEGTNKDLVGYYSMMGKELDRAERHFFTALNTLKQIKSPMLEMNIHAKTAFIAQNQQINATPPQS